MTMSWFKTKELRSSLYAIFTAVSTSAPPDESSQLEKIREAMLALVALDGGGDRSLGLTRRIRYATDLQALWFMRGEVMGLLARTYGEAASLEMLEPVSDLFGNLLPRGLRSRPSPLNPSYRNSRPDGSED
jgi:hypothetical protein